MESAFCFRLVCPTTRLAVTGATTTVATGTDDTVMDTTALSLSDVAVMIAPPGATAVTNPLSVMVATEAALVAHEIGRPAST